MRAIPSSVRQWLQRHWFATGALMVGCALSAVGALRALDYPLCLVTSLIMCVGAAAQGIVAARTDPSIRGLASTLVRAATASVAVVVPGVAASALLGAVCEPLYGLLFWALGPLSSALLGAIVGHLSTRLVGARWAVVVSLVWLLSSVLIALAEFLWTPTIRFYGSAFGLYHGAVYDEAVFVEAAYVWLRLWNGMLAASALLCVYRRQLPRRWGRPLWVPAAVATIVLTLAGPNLGFINTGSRLEKALSAQFKSRHFVLRYAPGGKAEPWVPLMAADLEFRATQIAVDFGVELPSDPVEAFIYDSPLHKSRLMGAGKTSIAKPWLGQLHVHVHDVGSRLLHHELAHVMLADLAGSATAMPTNGWGIPRPGILEGAAVAAERSASVLTNHQWARAMRDVELLPDMPTILEGLAFWTQSSSRAYTACGSFVRFLLESYGPAKFAALYGGQTLSEAYGESMEQLLERWHRFLDNVPLSEADLALARFVFARAPVFDRQCPYAGARTLLRAQRAVGRGDGQLAVSLATRAMRLTGVDPGVGPRCVRVAMASGRLDSGEALLELIHRRHPDPGEVASQSLNLLASDLAWLARNHDRMRELLGDLLGSPFDRLTHPAVARRLAMVAEGVPDSFLPLAIGALPRRQLDSSLARFDRDWDSLGPASQLQVVALMTRVPAFHARAHARLGTLKRARLPAMLQRDIDWLGVKLAVLNRDVRAARGYLDDLADSEQTPAGRERLKDWHERIDWLSESPEVIPAQKRGGGPTS